MVSVLTYTTIDKSGWGGGPWQHEPDKVQWTDEATGLPCLVKRVKHSGHLCGYVGVPRGHRFYEVDYDDVRLRGYDDEDMDYDIHWPPAHCGLTYADHCQEGPEADAICHVPEPGEPDDVWWLGFDCAHSGDVSPAYADRYGAVFGDATYKTLPYVQGWCRRLAAWLQEHSA
jgi:hypothetical protein